MNPNSLNLKPSHVPFDHLHPPLAFTSDCVSFLPIGVKFCGQRSLMPDDLQFLLQEQCGEYVHNTFFVGKNPDDHQHRVFAQQALERLSELTGLQVGDVITSAIAPHYILTP